MNSETKLCNLVDQLKTLQLEVGEDALNYQKLNTAFDHANELLRKHYSETELANLVYCWLE